LAIVHRVEQLPVVIGCPALAAKFRLENIKNADRRNRSQEYKERRFNFGHAGDKEQCEDCPGKNHCKREILFQKASRISCLRSCQSLTGALFRAIKLSMGLWTAIVSSKRINFSRESITFHAPFVYMYIFAAEAIFVTKICNLLKSNIIVEASGSSLLWR
jgi:hypothetical protein